MTRIFYLKVKEYNSLPMPANYEAGSMQRVYTYKGKRYLIVPRMYARDVVECYVVYQKGGKYERL